MRVIAVCIGLFVVLMGVSAEIWPGAVHSGVAGAEETEGDEGATPDEGPGPVEDPGVEIVECEGVGDEASAGNWEALVLNGQLLEVYELQGTWQQASEDTAGEYVAVGSGPHSVLAFFSTAGGFEHSYDVPAGAEVSSVGSALVVWASGAPHDVPPPPPWWSQFTPGSQPGSVWPVYPASRWLSYKLKGDCWSDPHSVHQDVVAFCSEPEEECDLEILFHLEPTPPSRRFGGFDPSGRPLLTIRNVDPVIGVETWRGTCDGQSFIVEENGGLPYPYPSTGTLHLYGFVYCQHQ